MVHDNCAPIGIFDSGVGGLTVARTIIEQLPQENILYVGDTQNGPYGSLPPEQIHTHVTTIADDLVHRGVKALVIACNTASAICLPELRQRHHIPIIEVIAPTVQYAAQATQTGRVGVIATPATIASGVYQEAFLKNYGIHAEPRACPRFVDFVERGITTGRQILGLTQAYLEPLQQANIDTLVLGCTHYPMLSGLIQLTMGDHVQLVSNAEQTTRELKEVLMRRHLLCTTSDTSSKVPQRIFEATGDRQIFIDLATRFLGPALTGIGIVEEYHRGQPG